MLFKSNVLSTFNKKVRGRGEMLCYIYVFVMPAYASNSCILQNMCNSALWGHTFRRVAEFGVTPALPEQWAAAGQKDAFVKEQPAGSAGIQTPPRFLFKALWAESSQGEGASLRPAAGDTLPRPSSSGRATARGHPQLNSSLLRTKNKKINKYDTSYKYA